MSPEDVNIEVSTRVKNTKTFHENNFYSVHAKHLLHYFGHSSRFRSGSCSPAYPSHSFSMYSIFS